MHTFTHQWRQATTRYWQHRRGAIWGPDLAQGHWDADWRGWGSNQRSLISKAFSGPPEPQLHASSLSPSSHLADKHRPKWLIIGEVSMAYLPYLQVAQSRAEESRAEKLSVCVSVCLAAAAFKSNT